MIKLAKIVQIDSESVTLKIERNVQCSDCKSRCSDGFLGFLFNKSNKGEISVALNANNATSDHLIDERNFFKVQHNKNDVVGLNFNETELYKMALILYGMPILLFVIMLLIGYYLFGYYDLNSDIGGMIGFVSGLFLSKYAINSLQSKIKPKVTFFN